jgi:DNA-binding PadR family transcriptional regulator
VSAIATARSERGRPPAVVSRAVLGLLIERPAYQYQLASQIEQRIGPGWRNLSGQVSHAIKSFEEAELIRRVEREDLDSDARTVYEITDAGVAEFTAFLDRDHAIKLPRRPIQVQLAFAGKAQLPEVLERLDSYERGCAELLAEVLATYQRAVAHDARLLRADNLLLRLSLSADLAHLEAELGWAKHARETVSWLMAEDAVWPGQRASVREQAARESLFERLARDRPAGRRVDGADEGE